MTTGIYSTQPTLAGTPRLYANLYNILSTDWRSEASFQQSDEPSEPPPVIEVHACALGGIPLGREVLANMPVAPPLAE